MAAERDDLIDLLLDAMTKPDTATDWDEDAYSRTPMPGVLRPSPESGSIDFVSPEEAVVWGIAALLRERG